MSAERYFGLVEAGVLPPDELRATLNDLAQLPPESSPASARGGGWRATRTVRAASIATASSSTPQTGASLAGWRAG